MKKSCFFLLTILLFTLTSCATNTNSATNSNSAGAGGTSPVVSETPAVETPATETPVVSETPAVETPATETPLVTEGPLPSLGEESVVIREDTLTLTTSYSLGNGYSVSYQTEIYPEWIRLTDTELLEAVWENFGGTADLSDIATSLGIERFGGEKTAVAIIEKRSIVNTTDGWDFSTDSPSAMISIPILINNSDWNGISRLGAAFDYHGKTQISDGGAVISMTSNTWGPIPVIHIFAYEFTPEYPDGKSEIANTTFGLPGDDTRVALDISW